MPKRRQKEKIPSFRVATREQTAFLRLQNVDGILSDERGLSEALKEAHVNLPSKHIVVTRGMYSRQRQAPYHTSKITSTAKHRNSTNGHRYPPTQRSRGPSKIASKRLFTSPRSSVPVKRHHSVTEHSQDQMMARKHRGGREMAKDTSVTGRLYGGSATAPSARRHDSGTAPSGKRHDSATAPSGRRHDNGTVRKSVKKHGDRDIWRESVTNTSKKVDRPRSVRHSDQKAVARPSSGEGVFEKMTKENGAIVENYCDNICQDRVREFRPVTRCSRTSLNIQRQRDEVHQSSQMPSSASITKPVFRPTRAVAHIEQDQESGAVSLKDAFLNVLCDTFNKWLS